MIENFPLVVRAQSLMTSAKKT